MRNRRFTGKTGVKRRNNQAPFRKNKNRKTRRRCDRDEKIEENLMSSVSGEEILGYREPTMYDKLLRSLRQKEGSVEMEEDLDDNLESSDGSGGNEEERDDESSRPSDLGDDADSEVSDTDGIAKPSTKTSFHNHLGYELSKEEVNKLLEEKWNYNWELEVSNCKWKGTGECFLKELDMNSCYGLKPVLYKHWLGIFKESGSHDFHSSMQRSFFSICNSYRDILHHNKKPFYLRGREEDASIMDAYIMHSLNHVLMTRDLVKQNEAKLAKLQENMKGGMISTEAFLDRGFTRPKVLILLPLASIAFQVVQRLIKLTPPKYKANIENHERFLREFGSAATEDEDEDAKSRKTTKPSDYQALFGGNNKDEFALGVKFTRRSIRLYGDFYSSDMIIASPIGLKFKIDEAELKKDKDVDYLSSIEILIIDHADIILMQNWSHLKDVVKHMNQIPSQQHGTDIMRIRQWYLDGQASFYRQTMILSSHVNPFINALFNQHCLNYKGKVKLVCDYKSVLPKVVPQILQIYERFDTQTIEGAADSRFLYFTENVFPKMKDSTQGGIMVFISCSFDFVRIKKFLRSQEASFCQLGEGNDQSDISRARVWFFNGQRKIMIYSERAHFYFRYKIKGIQNLIIYSLPERKEFFLEVVNMLPCSSTCTVLFSRFDLLRLERIVGSAAAKRMITSDQDVFTFC